MLPRRSHSRTVRRGRLCVFLSVEKLRGRRERGKVRLSLQGSYFVGGSLEQSTSSMTWRTARWTPVASTLVALAAAWGCGNGSREPPRLPVSGTVTLDWRPLKSGQIRFQRSPSGPVSQAETSIIDGRYSISRDEGLVPGTYRVTICFASSARRAMAHPAHHLSRTVLGPRRCRPHTLETPRSKRRSRMEQTTFFPTTSRSGDRNV